MSDATDAHHQGSDAHDLAVALLPHLEEACHGRMSDVRWFRTASQRGGAATGFAVLEREGRAPLRVMLKLPVGPTEHDWTRRLSPCPREAWDCEAALSSVTPRVVASGVELGGHDVPWLVIERLGPGWTPEEMTAEHAREMIRSCFLFQQACQVAHPLPSDAPPPRSPQWEHLIERSREITRDHEFPEHTHWHDTLRKVAKARATLAALWEQRPINSWCHGDLHPHNALTRPGTTHAPPCVLIDLALVHAGHWSEDMLYLERQFWGYSAMLGGVKPVSVLAQLRREAGLPVDDHYPELAKIRRVLMAACAPAMLHREGNPTYLHAALQTLDTFLPQVPH